MRGICASLPGRRILRVFSSRTQPSAELADRLLVGQAGDPSADIAYAKRCLWTDFPILKTLFDRLAPAVIVLHVSELARASGMLGSAWASQGLFRLEARVSVFADRLSSDASVDARVASLARALSARPSGSTVGTSATRTDFLGGPVTADFQMLVQSDVFAAFVARVEAVDGVAVLPIVFAGVRSGLRILLYSFVPAYASKLASVHGIFAKIAACSAHLPLYFGQALVVSPIDQKNYELLSSFSVSTAVVNKLLKGEFAALFSDFNSSLYVPVYHALHGESVSAPADPYAWLLAVMRIFNLLFSAFGFDIYSSVSISAVCLSALSVVDSAPVGSRLQSFSLVREELARGFTLASARHQQFLAVLSVPSNSASSLFVASDAILEHLKSLEKLLFQTVCARVGRMLAAPPSGTTGSASRSRSSAPAPASSSVSTPAKKPKTSQTSSRTTGDPFSGTLNFVDGSSLAVSSVSKPDSGDIVGQQADRFARYIRSNNQEYLFVQSCSELAKAAGVPKTALCWPVVGAKSPDEVTRFRSCPCSSLAGHTTPSDSQHVQPPQLRAAMAASPALFGQRFSIP